MKIGDIIHIAGESSFCTPETTKVTNITTKYNEYTGRRYTLL